jgi:inorganic pyrophosphatase
MAGPSCETRPAACRFIGLHVVLKVDRPLGSVHPRFGFVYPLNYGYLPGELAPDGEYLDAYILGISVPLSEFSGCCIAVIHRTDDQDDKLVVVPDGAYYTDEQILELTEFQERFFQVQVLR